MSAGPREPAELRPAREDADAQERLPAERDPGCTDGSAFLRSSVPCSATQIRRLAGAREPASGRSGDAADAAGEAFVRAFERRGSPTWPDNPTGWVLVVAMNLARRPRVRALVHRRVEWAAGEPTTFELPDRELRVAVRRLPRRQREAITLRYAYLTEREVAEAMGVSVGTASATLTAARARLRRDLDEREPPA